MRVLVIANNKGGVGKTTLALSIADCLGRRGRRVLGIDLDPQCNFSRRYLDMEFAGSGNEGIRPPVHPEYDPNDPESAGWDGRSSSADIYLHGNAYIYPTRQESVDIIPGDSPGLLDVERVTKQDVVTKIHQQMRDWVWIEENQNDYDLVIIDTSPSKGPLTTSAIHAATHMLIPAEMEQMSVEGLYGMNAIRVKENMSRERGNELNLVGILPNKFDERLPLHHHFYEQLQAIPNVGEHLFPMTMHLWQDYKEYTMFGAKSVFDYAPSRKSRKELEEICTYIEGKLWP